MRLNKKLFSGLGIIAFIALSIVIYQAEQPGPKDPNPDWIESVSGEDLTRETFFVESGNITLEAELILPVGGAAQKPAVVFVTGSGDSLYQNYSPGLVEKYVQGVFLPRDFAVIYYNKRGMGQSGGSWLNNDFQGRAEDTYAVVNYFKDHPAVDGSKIGLIGHSQGGWIVNLTAAQHQDIAFFISLSGPTTSVEGNMEDNYRGFKMCEDGLQGEELEKAIQRQLRLTRAGAAIGKVLPFGIIGFDTNIIDYDPIDAIQNVSMPGLFVYGGHDTIVFAERNETLFYEIFDGNPPGNLSVAVIPNATHAFRVTDDVCTSYQDALEKPLSEDLVAVLENWLAANGY